MAHEVNSSSPEKQGEVWDGLGRIGSLLETLESKTTILKNRLVPVVIQAPQDEGKTAIQSNIVSTELGEVLRALGDHIQVCNDRLEFILKNLQI